MRFEYSFFHLKFFKAGKLFNRFFSTTIFTFRSNPIFDPELIEIHSGISIQPSLVHEGAHFYIINFEYSEEHLAHRRGLYRFLYDGHFLSNFSSPVSFILGIYWHFEYLLTDMENTLNVFSINPEERGLLRLVIRFLQNDALERLQRIGYIPLDIPHLLQDTQNLSYNILTECINNDIYCYMNIIRQCVTIERLCNQNSFSHSIRIDHGDYLLLFDFNPIIIENVCSLLHLDVLGIYYIEQKKGWLHKVMRQFSKLRNV